MRDAWNRKCVIKPLIGQCTVNLNKTIYPCSASRSPPKSVNKYQSRDSWKTLGLIQQPNGILSLRLGSFFENSVHLNPMNNPLVKALTTVSRYACPSKQSLIQTFHAAPWVGLWELRLVKHHVNKSWGKHSLLLTQISINKRHSNFPSQRLRTFKRAMKNDKRSFSACDSLWPYKSITTWML